MKRRRRRRRPNLPDCLRRQFGQLPLQRLYARGQGGKLRSDLTFLGWLLLLLVRDHGNYFTAISRRSGTEVRQLILFALRKKAVMPVQVLVIDDDALSRDVLALLLDGAGYAVAYRRDDGFPPAGADRHLRNRRRSRRCADGGKPRRGSIHGRSASRLSETPRGISCARRNRQPRTRRVSRASMVLTRRTSATPPPIARRWSRRSRPWSKPWWWLARPTPPTLSG